MEVVDGGPTRSAEFAIDLADQHLHIEVQLVVLWDVFAAWNHDLKHRYSSARFEMRLQQPSEPVQPLQDSFGVIQAIHAYHDLHSCGLFYNGGGRGARDWIIGRIEFVEIDADRIASY